MQIDTTAVMEQTGNKKKRNSVSFGGQMKSYFLHPGSGILAFLTTLAAVITFALLFFLIGYILVKGIPYLNADLFSPEYTSENVSLVPSLINTFIMTVISLVIAAPLGIFAAIYLVEYAKKGSKFVNVIRLTAETLSGIPSIVYGLFGMLFFVTTLKWGMSILSGAFTMVIMILPLIMRLSLIHIYLLWRENRTKADFPFFFESIFLRFTMRRESFPELPSSRQTVVPILKRMQI